MLEQLTLNVTLHEGSRFSSFFYDDENKDIITVLKLFSQAFQDEQQQLFLWGGSQSGKSHLLQACCYQLSEQGMHASYLPLRVLSLYGPSILKGLDNTNLIAIDDVDIILGDRDWEEGLFNLINQARTSEQRLLFSASHNSRDLICKLPDLATRLVWGSSYQLLELSSDQKPLLLKFRAQQRGFDLDDRVIDYIYKRYPRGTDSLLNIFDKLDEESLRQKAKITIPFVKQVLES
ncbi:MAG TPA: DnaA regulatory inactivator Hda [Leucothrix mucor]|nr:DnaA regulatory inactivator Hda [Leucothrix mucor]